MEGEMCPQVAVNDSYNCGGRPFYQYQFFPGRGFEGKYGVKQVPLPGRLNLNSDKPCMSNNEQRLNHEAGSQFRSGDWEGFSFMRNPDAENCCSAGDPVKSRESEGIEKIAPSDLRLDSSDNQSDASASDSHHFIDLCTVEQKRKQTLFSNGSPTDHTGSINGHDCVDGSLSLKLCPGSYSYMEDARNPKRYRSSSPGSQFPSCQVDDCHADLKHAKDYHRRHKVCETHSKTAQSLVHGLMQRFCQQCSRFHPLPEFDEGKRSCRRRLAGHNKRRRKPHTDLAALPLPDAVRGSELLSMVAILSQLQPSKTKERLDISSKEQDFILQCLKKTDSFLPLSTYLARDTAAAAHQAPPQPLPGLQRSGQESQTGLLTTLASLSPEALLSVLRNSMASQVSPTQGEVQHPHISQQPTRNDKDNAPLFAYGVSSGEELHKVSNGTVERSNIQFARPFPFSDLAARPNGRSNPSEWPSRPILTRQYLGPAGSHSKEGDSGSIPASNCAGAPAEQILFPALCGNGVRNETISRINGVVRHSESAERLLFVDGSDNRTSRQELSQNTVSDPPGREPSDGQDSGSDQSPASTSSDWQELNRRIIFKLFDKKSLEGFPQRYRAEIGEWLAIAPTSLELYLRPGCILLTVFLTMPQLQWEQLAANLRGSLQRLLGYSQCDLWAKGRVVVQVEKQRALILDGKVKNMKCLISNSPFLKSVRPLAVVAGEKTTLVVSGQNLAPQTKILCVYHGRYVLHEVSMVDMHANHNSCYSENEESGRQLQRLHFPGGPANVLGRCFVEVEHDLLGNFLPVIVADNAICTELRSLEQELDSGCSGRLRHSDSYLSDGSNVDKKAEAISFLHELGWVFQRSYSSQSYLDTEALPQLNLSRFKALLNYAVLHDWCAVVKKLLDLLFSFNLKKNDDSCEQALQILSEVNLVHQAVKRKCRSMVELLLQYTVGVNKPRDQNIFTPTMKGPAGFTPLHIAASISSAEDIVDALTNDPCKVGLHGWKRACDSSGRTPEWHALNSGNHSYIQLVDKKLMSNGSLYVSITISGLPHKIAQSAMKGKNLSAVRVRETVDVVAELSRFPREPTSPPRICRESITQSRLRHRFGASGMSGTMYRPWMMMMVAIATVCATVALLLKGPPHLECVYYSLKWEAIMYGSV